MTPEQAKKLREPFPDSVIGKLPKLACKACSDSPQKHCGKHQKTKCAECGNYISTAHVHLDYVGHAAATDRLLQVDPNWTWRPMAKGQNGEPLVTNGGLWIELTVADVTKPGFGDGKNPKEIIGDAIRNAAMRFGVALDLWAKEDLHALQQHTDSVGEPEADAVRDGREPVSVAQPVLDGGEAASPTDTETEGGGGSPSVDLSDPDIPFGDAPPAPPKPSAAQIKKLNVLVKAVGPESLAERLGPTLLNRVYATIADIRGWTTDVLVNTVGGKDAEGTLRWTPLRDALSKHEAHELIERLEKIEAQA